MAGWELAPLSWEAMAAFSAVAAAAVVGVRQTNIARGQRDIQARQVHLEEVKLRTEVFDRRFAIYEDVRKFLAAILTEGRPPDPPTEHVFLAAVERSRFLFRPQVYSDLNEVWRKASSYRAAHNVAKAEFSQERLDAESALFTWLADRALKVHEIFGNELVLTFDPAVS